MTAVSTARRAILFALVLVVSVALAMVATGAPGLGTRSGHPDASISLNSSTVRPDSISLN